MAPELLSIFRMRALTFFLLLPSLSSAASYFHSTTEIIEQFTEARVFLAEIDGVQVVGAEVGSKYGNPVVLVGDMGFSFPYLRKFVRSLDRHGFRVFLYNPPGQGRSSLYSGRGATKNQLGIDGILKVFPAVRHYAFQQSQGKKVIAIGHSLGGVQVRAGSVGLVFEKNGRASTSFEAQMRAQLETALVVVLFSPALNGDRVKSDVTNWLQLESWGEWQTCLGRLGCLLPWPLDQFPRQAAVRSFKRTQNSARKGLFGAQRLDTQDVDEISPYLVRPRISRQLREDLTRWRNEGRYTTSSGMDFGQEWKLQQESGRALPSFYITGQYDSVSDGAALFKESKNETRSRFLQVKAGHSGAFVIENLPERIMSLMMLRLDCDDILRK